jgi:hypothetical protein
MVAVIKTYKNNTAYVKKIAGAVIL